MPSEVYVQWYAFTHDFLLLESDAYLSLWLGVLNISGQKKSFWSSKFTCIHVQSDRKLACKDGVAACIL